MNTPRVAQVELRYKCECFTREELVCVNARRDDEDIAEWMKYVSSALHADHRRRSPFCLVDKMEYVKIPLADGDAAIGQPTKGNA